MMEEGHMTKSAKVAWGAFGGLVLLGLLFLLAMVATDPTDNVRLRDTSVRVAEDGSRFVQAAFRNRTDRPFSRVEVQVDFLDSEGSLLRTTTASVDGFEPDTDWNLEILVAPSAAAQAILRDMTCTRDGIPLTPEDCMVVRTVIELRETTDL
jgi:hypothetical protein